MVSIVQKNDSVLREKAKEVPVSEIQTPKIQGILKDMAGALEAEIDGVAIAAPQIGVSLRIFIVSHRSFEKEHEIKGEALGEKKEHKNAVFINPVFIKISKSRKNLEEGCLSVRYAYGKVSRATKATVRALDENGKPFERGGSGLLAQIFQHEIDHLDGVLFVDKATEIEEIPPEEIRKSKSKALES